MPPLIPYPIAGKIFDIDSVALQNATVKIFNLRTGQSLELLNTPSSGDYLFDLANMTDGYNNSDKILIRAWKEGLIFRMNETVVTIGTNETTQDLTLINSLPIQPKSINRDDIDLWEHNSINNSKNVTLADSNSNFATNNRLLEALNTVPINYESAVTRGKVLGASTIDKFGQNIDVDAAADEDLWSHGGTWIPPTQSRKHNIVSDSANDNGTGTTGALTINIIGLSGGIEVNEDITLNGTSNVPTVNSYTIIYRMEVLTVGSTGSNIGVITATAQTDGTVTASILATHNQTRMAIFQIPTNAQGTLHSFYFTINAGTPASTKVTMELQEKKNIANSPWVTKHIEIYDSSVVSKVQHFFNHHKKIDAGSFIKMRVGTDKDNTSVNGGFNILVVND